MTLGPACARRSRTPAHSCSRRSPAWKVASLMSVADREAPADVARSLDLVEQRHREVLLRDAAGAARVAEQRVGAEPIAAGPCAGDQQSRRRHERPVEIALLAKTRKEGAAAQGL